MAKEKFEDVLAQDSIDLSDKFLTVETVHDGYADTWKGQYIYYIEADTVTIPGEDEAGDTEEVVGYKVYPTYFEGGDTLKTGEHPIIIADEDMVAFSVATLKDVYGASYPEKVEIHEGMDTEHAVLLAFDAFARDRFQFGGWHILFSDKPFVDDDEDYVFETE